MFGSCCPDEDLRVEVGRKREVEDKKLEGRNQYLNNSPLAQYIPSTIPKTGSWE
jgi:hypothetical protein